MLKFYLSDDPDQVAQYMAHLLNLRLQAKKKVLWLLSGGSAIAVAVAVSKSLKASELDNLTVTLVDERYGAVGHHNSNGAQLEKAGFELPGANLQPVLINADINRTTSSFKKVIESHFQSADYKLALIGIGPDGHTAGILPNSPAINSPNMVASYKADDYGQRVTITPRALTMLDEAVVYAGSEAKHEQLKRLEQDLPIETQPAQILKQIKKVTIFNDYKGDVL
jgi:6-phosphogluconolactonase/glucosamine-6-phosphate isomerase/deaminase